MSCRPAREKSDHRGPAIAVFNIKGEYFGLLNRCPHQGAALCKGPLIGSRNRRIPARSNIPGSARSFAALARLGVRHPHRPILLRSPPLPRKAYPAHVEPGASMVKGPYVAETIREGRERLRRGGAVARSRYVGHAPAQFLAFSCALPAIIHCRNAASFGDSVRPAGDDQVEARIGRQRDLEGTTSRPWRCRPGHRRSAHRDAEAVDRGLHGHEDQVEGYAGLPRDIGRQPAAVSHSRQSSLLALEVCSSICSGGPPGSATACRRAAAPGCTPETARPPSASRRAARPLAAAVRIAASTLSRWKSTRLVEVVMRTSMPDGPSWNFGQPRQQPFGGERSQRRDRQHLVVVLAQQPVGGKPEVVEGGVDTGRYPRAWGVSASARFCRTNRRMPSSSSSRRSAG